MSLDRHEDGWFDYLPADAWTKLRHRPEGGQGREADFSIPLEGAFDFVRMGGWGWFHHAREAFVWPDFSEFELVEALRIVLDRLEPHGVK